MGLLSIQQRGQANGYAVEDGMGPLSIQQLGQANGQRNNAGERRGRGGNSGVQGGRRERPEQPLSLGGNQNGRGERGPQPLHFERHVRNNDKNVLVEAPRRNHQVQYEGRYGSWSGYTEEIGERQIQAQTRASQNGRSAPVIIPSPVAAAARPSQQPRLSGLLNSTTSNSVASSSNSNSSPPLSSTSTNPQANIDDDDKPLRLHFGGLAFGTTCVRIVELCAPYGEVFDPYVPKQRNGRLMPMAFITFVNGHDGRRAKDALHKTRVDGRIIRVTDAR